VPERGVRLERIFAMAAHRGDPALGPPMVRRPSRSRKGTAPARSASGAEETRTPDVLLAKEVLYQLSYGPEAAAPLRGGQSGGLSVQRERVWAFLDSNQRPLPYQGSALTN
jgi:hypothetical protein